MAVNIPVPVFKIGGTSALVTALYVIVLLGSMHLLALSFPNSRFSKTILALGF